jgi:hypothetical protein
VNLVNLEVMATVERPDHPTRPLVAAFPKARVRREQREEEEEEAVGNVPSVIPNGEANP